MMFRLDMDKHGLFILFKDYQVKALGYLIRNKSCYSRDIYNSFRNDASRASFIQFLNKLSSEPLNMVTINVETSKGGYRNKYTLKDKFMSERKVLHHITKLIHKKLSDEMISIYGDEVK